MRSGRRYRRHSQSPRAAQSLRERSERASEQASSGGAWSLSELGPVVSTALQGPPRGTRGSRRVQERSPESPRLRRQSHSTSSCASQGVLAHRPAGPEPVARVPAVPGMV
ncbi:hypothetical protein ACRRTK_011607 [Alexandromys fortis]